MKRDCPLASMRGDAFMAWAAREEPERVARAVHQTLAGPQSLPREVPHGSAGLGIAVGWS